MRQIFNTFCHTLNIFSYFFSGIEDTLAKNKNIVIGITGGISAYKACGLVSYLKSEGANVYVIMTKNACNFITPLTLETLSSHEVVVDMFKEKSYVDVKHISLAKMADLFLIVPASANIIGKVANGIADDMLSTTIMATTAPVIFAPAMNTNMYKNPIVQGNIRKLREYNYLFIEPDKGMLACGDIGSGKLPSTKDIVESTKKLVKERI